MKGRSASARSSCRASPANKEGTTEKTAIAIDGDAGMTISTKLAEAAGNDAVTQQVMGVLGGVADCGAAVAGAVVSGGAGTGGAIAACGQLIAGGAWLAPSRHAAVPACAPCLLRAKTDPSITLAPAQRSR